MYVMENVDEYVSDLVLEHPLIEMFTRELFRFTDRIDYNRGGLFVSAMINEAYADGVNGFVLDLRGQKGNMRFISRRVKGTPDQPVEILIKGYAGMSSSDHQEHCKVRFKEFPGQFSVRFCKHSTYVFESWSDHLSVEHLENCTVYFNDVPGIGNARMSTGCDFYFMDGTNSDCGDSSLDCRFHSPDLEVLEDLLSEAGKGCRFYLMHDDGSEEEVFK
jgi:hypothetical protein